MQCQLMLILVVLRLTFIFPLVLASPISVRPVSHPKNVVCGPRKRVQGLNTPLRPASHVQSARVEVETVDVVLRLPSTTATLKEVIAFHTGPPDAITISQPNTTSSFPTFTTTPSSAGSSASSTFPVAGETAGLSTTSYPGPRGLATGSLLVIAIAGSVAVNIITLAFCLLFRRFYLQRVGTDEVGTENFEVGRREEIPEKHNPNPIGSLTPRDFSHIQLGQQAPSVQRASIQRRFPFSFPSFWSSASSWSLERARSQEQATPRLFTTFGLSEPIASHSPSNSFPNNPSEFLNFRRRSSDHSIHNASPAVKQEESDAIMDPPAHGSGKLSADPRSPRGHSIPLFMENYSSPSLTNNLPPESKSAIITESRKGSYSIRASSLLHDVESHTENEFEPQLRQVSTSLASLPSVSSEMTPRRHWTFVDVHGPSNSPLMSYGTSSIVDRLSGTESPRTISVMDGHSTGTDYFAPAVSARASGSASELPSAHSFLQHANVHSTSSGFTQYRSANSDILRDAQHGGQNI